MSVAASSQSLYFQTGTFKEAAKDVCGGRRKTESLACSFLPSPFSKNKPFSIKLRLIETLLL